MQLSLVRSGAMDENMKNVFKREGIRRPFATMCGCLVAIAGE